MTLKPRRLGAAAAWRQPLLTAAVLAAVATTAQAGLLDEFRKVKQAADAVPAKPAVASPATPATVVAPAAPASGIVLRPYPRAVQLGRYDNPLEAATLPISPPERDNKSGRTSRWRLPYEGSVTMVQYRHEADDSPLLIARHYAGQLRDLGFELVTICNLPCAAPDGSADASVYWFPELDPAKRLNYGAFGDRGLYLIGHRADAVVAVRVGAGSDKYVSTIKSVSAQQLDRGPLLAYVESISAPVADAPLPPPPSRRPAPPAAAASTPAATPGPLVTAVAPADLSAWVRNSKGWVVLQLSSYDPKCTYCIPANPPFDALARSEGPSGISFARVAFQPWTSLSGNDFVVNYAVQGIPAYFTFKDGQLMRRHQGNADEATLRRSLLDGLR